MSSVTVQGPTCLTPCKTGFHMWVFPASPFTGESNIKRSQHRSLTLVSQRIRNDSFLTQTDRGQHPNTGNYMNQRGGWGWRVGKAPKWASFGVLSNSSPVPSVLRVQLSSQRRFSPVWSLWSALSHLEHVPVTLGVLRKRRKPRASYWSILLFSSQHLHY